MLTSKASSAGAGVAFGFLGEELQYEASFSSCNRDTAHKLTIEMVSAQPLEGYMCIYTYIYR